MRSAYKRRRAKYHRELNFRTLLVRNISLSLSIIFCTAQRGSCLIPSLSSSAMSSILDHRGLLLRCTAWIPCTQSEDSPSLGNNPLFTRRDETQCWINKLQNYTWTTLPACADICNCFKLTNEGIRLFIIPVPLQRMVCFKTTWPFCSTHCLLAVFWLIGYFGDLRDYSGCTHIIMHCSGILPVGIIDGDIFCAGILSFYFIDVLLLHFSTFLFLDQDMMKK